VFVKAAIRADAMAKRNVEIKMTHRLEGGRLTPMALTESLSALFYAAVTSATSSTLRQEQMRLRSP
jgi:hypothetical protein